jgi:hypothetical protein
MSLCLLRIFEFFAALCSNKSLCIYTRRQDSDLLEMQIYSTTSALKSYLEQAHRSDHLDLHKYSRLATMVQKILLREDMPLFDPR